MEWQWPLDVEAAEKSEEGGSFAFHQWTELCEWTRGGEYEGGAGPGSPAVGPELRWAETRASRHPHASPSGKGNYISPF